MRQLNSEQARAVKHFNGPMLVLAGPGSGKTFTLVERIRYLIEARGVNPSLILTITFSKKASIEMKTRFFDLIGDKFYPVTFGTFHSIFYNILKTYHSYSIDSILTPNEKIKYMKRVLRKHGSISSESEDCAIDMLSKISAYKSVSEAASNSRFFEKYFENDEKKEEFLKVYDEYDKLCKLNDKIDFDDMIVMCLRLLKENEGALKKWREIFKYFLVDEFQDINDLQYEVLMLLAGDEKNIFAVGDDDQSIYAFRGSEPKLMKRFLELDGCKVVDMYKNYRCAENVITAAGCLISENKERIVKNQISEKDDKSGSVYVASFISESEEADFIINKLLDMKGHGERLNDIAVLYRTERCAAYLEEKLKMSGIGYLRSVKQAGFYESDWVKDIISYLKIASGEYEMSDLYRIINKPEREISREDIYEYENGEESEIIPEFISEIEFISDMTCFAAINYILKGLGYYKYFLKRSLMQKINRSETDEEVESLLLRAKGFNSIKNFLEYIEEYSGSDGMDSDNKEKNEKADAINEENAGKIVLQTAHSSKGLEYDTVFIIGLTEGLFPHHKARTDAEIEEERRLMYVAMTRAKKTLYILGRGEEKHGKKVSRFVLEAKRCGKTEDIRV